MPARNNSASRVGRVILRVKSSHPDGTAVIGWSRVFTYPKGNGDLTELEVSRNFSILHDELDAVTRSLQKEEKDPESYEPIIAQAKELFTLRTLPTSWAQIKQDTQASLGSSLLLLSEFLPVGDITIDDDTLMSLIDELDEWLAKVDNSQLPRHVKAFLFREIHRIRRSVFESQLRGDAAFQDGLYESMASWSRQAPDMAGYEQSEVVQGVRSFWSRVDTLSRRTLLIGGATVAVLSPIEKLLMIFGQVKALPPAPTPPDEGEQRQLPDGSVPDGDTRPGPSIKSV